jgi:putative ABC transport system ATP-binding protein
VEVEYVYEDENGNPIPVPLGTYRPEDFEEEVVEVGDGDVPARPQAPDEAARETCPAAPAASAAPLELGGVWRGYRSGGGRVEVLKGVGMRLAAGELAVVAGPSGSGKSTLLSVMGGLLRADRGRVAVYGKNLTDMSEPQMQAVRRRELGFIFQNVYLMAALPAVENVRIAYDIKGRTERGGRSEMELLEMVGMADYANRLPRALSGGQCQRVAVARALAGGPRVILADEPTASLDTDNALSVMELLRRLTREEGLATAVVTHDVRLFKFADRVMSLDGGKLREVHKHDGK